MEHYDNCTCCVPSPHSLPTAQQSPTRASRILTLIQNSILKAVISESSPSGGSPNYKYAVNSTIIQHLVPTASLNKPAAKSADTEPNEAVNTDGKAHVGRRGMHSATGAYWNEKTDGMWSFKYEGGEEKGLDVVISVIWISI